MKALIASVVLCAASGCAVVPVAQPVYGATVQYRPPVVYTPPAVVYTPQYYPYYYNAVPRANFNFHYYHGWRR